MSISSSAAAAPETSARRSGPVAAARREDGAVVVGVGVAIEQLGAVGEGGLESADLIGVAALGDVGDREQRQLHQELPAADERLAVDADIGVDDDAIEMDRDLDLSADPGRGAEGDMGRAEDLLVLEDLAGEDRLLVGADAELGDVGAVGAVGAEQLQKLPARLAARLSQVPLPRRPASTGSESLPIPAIEPATTRVPSPVPSTGAMNPSPQGRLPNAPGSVSSPASGIALRGPRSPGAGRCPGGR